MRDRLIFTGQFIFTLLVAAFLVVPAGLSISAGVTVNYFRGIQSGVTLQWVAQVWELYAGTILLSFVIAFATLAVTLLVGVPAAYALHARGGRLARIVEEIITLPLAIPGLAIALALLLAYGSLGDFRRSWLFILVGHVIFTMPFMVRSVMAVFATVDIKTLDEGAASLGASPWRRFCDVIVPNALVEPVIEAIAKRLDARVRVGDPRTEGTTMGALASLEQLHDVRDAVDALIAGGGEVDQRRLLHTRPGEAERLPVGVALE